ncbi:MAG: hypothetical protein SFU56_06295 [Capsulimonadales bacterium]|nr:hypothetical protein [Capsulimonadales bacterium]
MKCHECQTENPAENKFCRECGTMLAPADAPPSRDEMMRRQAKVAELLSDALRLRDKGLRKEALALAEEASRRMPESVRALGLLTSLYEQEGNLREAIAAMERIVLLTPDSVADQEKLAELRRQTLLPTPLPIAHGSPSASPARALPSFLPLAVAGVVAGVVFFSLLPLVSRKKTAPSVPVERQTALAVAPQPVQTPFFDPVTPLQQPLPPPVNPPVDPFSRQRPPETPAPVSIGSGVSQLPELPSLRNRPRVARRPSPTPVPFRSVDPMPVAPPGTGENGALPGFEGEPASGETSSENGGFGNGGRLTVRPPSEGARESAISAGPPAENGSQSYIYIKVHPAPVSSGKEEPTPTPPAPRNNQDEQSGVPATPTGTEVGMNRDMERARSLQGAGHYPEAIRAYRHALSSGARGDAYQGIAQSYQRMGDEESARASYREAIRAYQHERPARPRLAQQGIETCEAALTLLGG